MAAFSVVRAKGDVGTRVLTGRWRVGGVVDR